MTEGRSELEASLAEIDRKLRDLQRELQVVVGGGEGAGGAPAAAEPPPTADPRPPQPAAPPPPPEPPSSASFPEPPRSRLLDDTAERVAELGRRIDDLQRLSEELEQATRALQEEFSRSASAPTWSGEVVVRAGPFRNIASLSEFERALGAIPGAEEAYVRSFAGDRALVELRLSGAVDLVAEMRRALPWEVRLVESGAGELEISLES